MSRSFKKTPGHCDRNPWFKRYANHIVRQNKLSENLVDGKNYKRYFNSWTISDYKFLYFSKQELLRDCQEYEKMKFYQAYMK